MTLVISTAGPDYVWMVSDTAITDPKYSLRDRVYLPKVERSLDKGALIGFAGNDAMNAARLAVLCRNQTAGPRGLDVLVKGSRENPNVEFAYAFIDNRKPQLFKVFLGVSEQTPTLYLGIHSAFKTFQHVRHDAIEPYPPLALKTFVAAAKGAAPIPDDLATAIVAMIDLFATRVERDVGGWAVPYILTSEGASFCAYSYGVSDPIFDRLVPGSVVPHGTPQAGGTTLSVTELPDQDGMIVYWLQIPGGLVLVRTTEGTYEQHRLLGTPTDFKRNVQAVIGQIPDLWIGDQPLEPIKSLRIMRALDGKINAVIGDHGDAFTFVAHNLATRFKFSIAIEQPQARQRSLFGCGNQMSAKLSEDKRSAVLSTSGDSGSEVRFDASELDALIHRLGALRMQMADPVPVERGSGVETLVTIDPIWRTERIQHPELEGIVMTLRHVGLGWIGFLLPYHEARSIGRWLVDNTMTPAASTTEPDPF